MEIPENTIQIMRQKRSISSILHTQKSLIECPVCGEPTFHLLGEDCFVCYNCGINGDIFSLLHYKNKESYIKAVQRLSKKFNVEINESQNAIIKKRKERLYALNRAAAVFFYEALYGLDGKRALKYLHNRGLSDDVIKHFGLGYAPSGFDLVHYLKSKGFSDQEMIMGNIANISKRGYLYSRFNDRVMFPIINNKGVVAFGGRTMCDDKAKYLNTSETLIFSKRNTLFALNFALQTPTEQIILAEGYMDVIALHRAGFTNAVASLGTSLTEEQAQLLSKHYKEVVICYDADEAGQKATERALEIFRKTPIVTKTLVVPNGKDPDEFIKAKGSDAFGALLQTASRYDYMLSHLHGTSKIEKLASLADHLCQLTEEDAIECIQQAHF